MPNRIFTNPPISLGYVGSKLDRISERRRDTALIEKAMRHPDAGVYALAGDIILLRKRGEKLDPLLSPAEASALGEPVQTMFIGLAGDAARSGIAIRAESAERAKESGEYDLIDLRSIAVQGLADAHLPALASAKAVLLWHAKHRFCSNCGAETRSVEAGWRRDCQK